MKMFNTIFENMYFKKCVKTKTYIQYLKCTKNTSPHRHFTKHDLLIIHNINVFHGTPLSFYNKNKKYKYTVNGILRLETEYWNL